MAETVLNRVINKEVEVELLVKWLLGTNLQEQYFRKLNDFKCTRSDFLTYFLNFVHEEVPYLNRYREATQKINTSKRCEQPQNDDTYLSRKLSVSLNESSTELNQSASYSYSLQKSSEESPTVCRSSSTPKVKKIQSDFIANNSHLSPISPLYRNQHSFSPPRVEQSSFTQTPSGKSPSLCLGDFIVNRKSSTKKKTNRSILTSEIRDESTRRIKPTSLYQGKPSCSLRKTDNSFNNFQNTQEVPADRLNDNRHFLVEERLKILSRTNSGSNTVVPSTKKVPLLNFKTEIEPDVNSVSHKEELDCFIEIYISILRNSLILNVTSEIYFLISLLLTKHCNEDKENASVNSNENTEMGVDFLDEESRELQGSIKRAKITLHCSDLFESVHNMVYFASRCLETQMDILQCCDKTTLNLLCHNKRLQAFAHGFVERLGRISQKKTERVLELPEANVQTTVCFNLDTDNRDNFPTEATFHAFRKQRDLFYDILRIWEQQHLVTGWNFSSSLGGKIKGLFGLQSDPATFVHFSRLFKAQLLSSCGKFQKEENLSDISFLTTIVDADKLTRLNSRLVNKQSCNGINSVPVFTEYQEFYRDFIVTASNYMFNKHLCDTLIAEILELNDKFSCEDLEDKDNSVDPSARKSYLTCVKSLRVLAKFLGFVESLPYKSDCSNLSKKVLSFQISLRKEVIPNFDVRKLLENALKQNTVVLTIPWLTKYLSMLDYITLRLPYYVSMYRILFDLHRNSYKMFASKTIGSNYNAALVKICLGWLFELPHFPDSEYFNFCTLFHENGAGCAEITKTHIKGVKDRKLDNLNIIDQNILYICCPFLEEIKNMLSNNSLKSFSTTKHITPVTEVQSSEEIAKKLELQIEEAFLNGQPLSVRKTIEFVSERVASACVKHICSTLVPTFKKEAIERLKIYLASWSKEHNLNLLTKEKSLKASLRSKVNHMAQADVVSLKETCNKEIFNIAKERIPLCITNLLSVDVLPQARDVCVVIATRVCLERVQQWIISHVTLSVFTKDFQGEMQKVFNPEMKKTSKEKPVFLLPPGGSEKNHNENATSAFHLMEKVKEFSVVILEDSVNLSERDLIGILNEAYVTLTQRCDVNECINVGICTLLVDVSLLLISHKPSVMLKEELLRLFTSIWKCYAGKDADLFKNLFCPRNVMLLAQSCNEIKVWETFGKFVVFLIKERILTSEQFESLCMEFYRKDWDQGTVDNFSIFLRKFLQCYDSNPDKFTLLLEFLSDFCADF